jgi:hypothetical protein
MAVDLFSVRSGVHSGSRALTECCVEDVKTRTCGYRYVK